MLERHFDSVVMLTRSDWEREPRSNRYHYARRFARHLPVWFVQPDRWLPGVRFRSTELDGVTVAHAHQRLGSSARHEAALLRALRDRGVRRPLLWIYNTDLSATARRMMAPLKIYHATEDYFRPGASRVPPIAGRLRVLLRGVDLLVACSPGVLESYRERGEYDGPALMLPNGCDFHFFAPPDERVPEILERREPRTALFQGGLNQRLDFELLNELADRLPDWRFRLCGNESPRVAQELRRLEARPNVERLGRLPVERVRELSYRCSAGLIPFVSEDYITRSSLPLKAYEYVACGLPVVTVPIDALASRPDCFHFATDAAGFAERLRQTEGREADGDAFRDRLEVAAGEDYDLRFAQLAERVDQIMAARSARSPTQVPAAEAPPLEPPARSRPLNVVVLYDPGPTFVGAVRDHLNALRRHSRHRIHYVAGTLSPPSPDTVRAYDAVVVHYSMRVCRRGHLHRGWHRALADFPGLKLLFIQDEYDHTELARAFVEQCGIDLVLTCVPDEYRERVYPRERFPGTTFIQTLTGFVPDWCLDDRARTPLRDRPWVLGYRGRRLPYWYGDLGREKVVLAERMRSECERRGVPANISCEDEDRIYGDGWRHFLESCRAVLGSESGANVFDFDGTIRSGIETALRDDPHMGYDEAHARFIGDREGHARTNQISPRVFEAIGSGAALVLFEGRYSGVLEPDRHFIPVRKDFSNVDEVLDRLDDLAGLERMVDRARTEVLDSGRYTYARFVQDLDAVMSEYVRRGQGLRLLTGLRGFVDSDGRTRGLPDPTDTLRVPGDAIREARAPDGLSASRPLSPLWIRAGRRLPTPLRRAGRRLLQRLGLR